MQATSGTRVMGRVMGEPKKTTKLAVILSADVVGYDRLVADDADATAAELARCQALVRRRVEARGGRILRMADEECLVAFASAVDALRASVALQSDLRERNAALPIHRHLCLRMGLDLGEIEEQADGTAEGDALTIATRIGTMLHGEGICVTEAMVSHARGDLYLSFDYLTDLSIDGIANPVRIYRIIATVTGPQPVKLPLWTPARIALAAACVLVAGATVVWHTVLAPQPVEVAEVSAEPEPVAELDPALAPTIAVMPFANNSDDPEQRYFADGLAVDITTRLTRFADLRVIASASSFHFRGTSDDRNEVAKALGARFLLEGAVRKARSNVRVTTTLIDMATEQTVWAETYERDLTAADIFAVQDDITERVVGVIAAQHGMIRQVRLEESLRRPPQDMAAVDCVLRSYAYEHELEEIGHAEMRDCLEAAVEDDPSYAEAWTQLATIYVEEHSLGFNPRANPLERAVEAAEKAVRLDPRSQFAHSTMAHAYFMHGDLDRFRSSAERAIQINPGSAEVLALLGLDLAYSGQWDRGIALVEKARSLNPFHPDWLFFPLLLDDYRKGDYEAALEDLEQIEMPDFFWTHVMRVQINGQLGRAREASEALERLRELYPGFSLDAAREEYKLWQISDELIEQAIDGLRKAGVPDGTWN